MIKICTKCNVSKNIDDFHKDSSNSKGFSSACKRCVSTAMKNSYHKKTKDERLKYYNENKEKCLQNGRLYVKNNYLKRREYMNSYERIKMQTDPTFKLRKYLGSRLRTALKAQKAKKNQHILDLCGLGYEAIREYIEKQFKPGMTWDNHGMWHIDHIRPVSSFNLHDPEEVKKCFHYTNLQPLWAFENLSKSNKIIV